MEIRAFAEQILLSDSLDAKLRRPTERLTDHTPGDARRVDSPVRPANLQFAARGTAPQMPKPEGFIDPTRRAIAHHIMANHELQALEVMAMVLMAFPEAPAEFRSGMVEIIFDEQRHTRLHANRAADLGTSFGCLPVNCYIWQKAAEYSSPLEYVAGLPLVFEGANLDHTVEFEDYFLRYDDKRGADIMRAIHLDEIKHVQFGLHWLRKWKDPKLSDFEAWENALTWPIQPANAKGDLFQRDARLAAGMDEAFIENVRTSQRRRPE